MLKNNKCSVCKKNFTQYNSLTKVCSVECAIEYAKVNVKTQQAKISRLEKQKLQNSVTGLPELKKLLETQINAICRLLDYNVPCISCDGTTTPQAGHYHSVQKNGSIRFNLFNVHIQDYNCNCAKGGNQHAYDLGLIKMYGKEYWEYVKFELPQQYPVLKITKPEILEAITKAKELVKALKKANISYSLEQRKRLRGEYNAFIGIYTLPHPI